jgi:hypothetical protein
MGVKEIKQECVNWIFLALDKDNRRVFVNRPRHLLVP